MNRQIVLRRRPKGPVQAGDFALVESPAPVPRAGQVLVRNLYLSLDPATRGWMDDRDSYMKPIAVGAPVRSAAISRVEVSKHRELRVGDLLVCLAAWEELSVLGPKVTGQRIPEASPVPVTHFLSVLGGNGLTAYFGILDVGRPVDGEAVLVSAAAGGVGSVAGQIAKMAGAKVVGIAGSDEKCTWIAEELGFDSAINYRETDVDRALAECCPEGIDVYFDNVGGGILEAALRHINVGARVVLCGAISQLDTGAAPVGPRNYLRLLTKRARMEGFITLDYADRWAEASRQLAQWVVEGRIRHREDIREGLESAPPAFLALFDGSHKGKLIVKLGDRKER